MTTDLRTDIEALRDEWRDEGEDFEINESQAADRLTALLVKHAAPAGPDLRAMVLALREISKRLHYPDVKSDSGPAEVHRYLYDLMTIADSALKAAAPAAPKEWRGPVRCNKCSKVYSTAPSAHYWSWNKHPNPRELCDGTFVPYERRKGGGG